MRLKFMPKLRSWVFTAGWELVQLVNQSGPLPMFYTSRESALYAASMCGIAVDTNNRCIPQEK